jgi:hypothetical protein
MPFFAGETCVDVSDTKILGKLRTNDARAQYEDVGVVMLHALMGGVCVMAKAGTDSRNFIGGHRRSYTASADQDATLRIAAKHAQADGLGEVRVIDRLRVGGADVLKLMAALLKIADQESLEVEAGMIGANSDAHLLVR